MELLVGVPRVVLVERDPEPLHARQVLLPDLLRDVGVGHREDLPVRADDDGRFAGRLDRVEVDRGGGEDAGVAGGADDVGDLGGVAGGVELERGPAGSAGGGGRKSPQIPLHPSPFWA